MQGFETLGFDDRDIIAVSGSQSEELCLLLLAARGKKMKYFKIECSACFSGFLTCNLGECYICSFCLREKIMSSCVWKQMNLSEIDMMSSQEKMTITAAK